MLLGEFMGSQSCRTKLLHQVCCSQSSHCEHNSFLLTLIFTDDLWGHVTAQPIEMFRFTP